MWFESSFMSVSGPPNPPKRICAMTTSRNDTAFLKKWIAYYGDQLGRNNLLILLDGLDQPLPDNAAGLNVVQLPFRPAPRAIADRRRARVMSHFAAGMFQHYDLVIATDVDEFLVVDPHVGLGLRDYLSSRAPLRSVAGLGMDVGQHPELEGALDLDAPILGQRRFARVAARYSKMVVLGAPAVWGSGMHRVKGQNFRMDPNLFLFHFGMSDTRLADARASDADRLNNGWGNHLKRRSELNRSIATVRAPGGEAQIESWRKRFARLRSLVAWNKPMFLPGEPVVIIPERFRGVL